LIPKKAYLNQNNDNYFNIEVEVGPEKEKKETYISLNEFQKNYGSSIKKKFLRDHNTKAYINNVSHILPTKNNHNSNNLLSNIRYFILLAQQKLAATSIMTTIINYVHSFQYPMFIKIKLACNLRKANAE